MKLILARNSLAKALDFVTRTVERRTTIPILSNVRLEATNAGLSLAATDLDMEAKTFIEADVETPGALTVAASTLHDIVRKLSEKALVSLEAVDDGARLAVKAGRAKFALQALPVSDWPEIVSGDLPHKFTLAATTLARALAKTSFAISNEEFRYYLNGVYMHVAETPEGDKLRVVATDGHRLASFECDAPDGAKGMPGIIIPTKACKEAANLVKSIAADDGMVRIGASAQKILFEMGTASIVSKLIDGSYPDYQRVIPAGSDRRATLDRETLAQATGRVSTVSGSGNRGRAIKLEFGDDKLTLSVTNADIGNASEDMEADYAGGALQIGFNAGYLIEILGAFDGDKVFIDLGDSGSPTIFRSSADEDLLVVLMPMRV